MRCIGRELEPEDRREAVVVGVEGHAEEASARGIDEMPAPPLVRSTQLISTRRMISPKASVTMAR